MRNRNLLNLSRSKLRLQELRIGHMSSAPYGKPRITNQVSLLYDPRAACSGAAPEAGGWVIMGRSTRALEELRSSTLQEHQGLLSTSAATG